MRLRKIFNFVLGLVLSLCCIMPISACNTATNNSPIFTPIYNSTMDLYEQQKLSLLDGIDVSLVKFSVKSGKENVEITDDTLFALKEGRFTIQAEYNGTLQNQTINVVKGGNPTIEVEDLPLLIGASYKLLPKTSYKNKIINGLTYALSSSNQSVVSIEGQTLTAVNEGVSTISVTANYKNSVISTASFNCTVNGNRGIIPNMSSYNLYLCDNFLGVEFDTELPLYGSVYNNGALVEDAVISWTIDNTEIATINDGKIIAQALGETSIKGVSTVSNTTIETIDIPIVVKTATVQSNTPTVIDLSNETHEFDSQSIFGVDVEVGSLLNTQTLKTYNVSNNKIQSSLFKSGEYEYDIYSLSNVYAIKTKLIVADYVVSDLDSLKNMYDYTDSYIAMINDIEINGTYSASFENQTTFGGTFNGLGHKIIGMTLSKGQSGLFHKCDGATIKNVGFVNAKITKEAGNGVLCYQSRNSFNVDNVYIDVKMSVSTSYDFNGGAIGLLFGGTLDIRNSIIICQGLYNNGVLDEDNGALLGRSTGSVVMYNSYIITDGYACATKVQENNTSFKQVNLLQGIYSSEEEFLADKNNEYLAMDFSGYNSNYWDLNGVPSYK